jgi:hypothetical protein
VVQVVRLAVAATAGLGLAVAAAMLAAAVAAMLAAAAVAAVTPAAAVFQAAAATAAALLAAAVHQAVPLGRHLVHRVVLAAASAHANQILSGAPVVKIAISRVVNLVTRPTLVDARSAMLMTAATTSLLVVIDAMTR